MTPKSKVTEAALAGEELPDGVTMGETPTTVFPRVKQIMRFLSARNPQPQDNHYAGSEVDDYLSYWIREVGYELFSTHYLGKAILSQETKEEAFGFMYILTLKE